MLPLERVGTCAKPPVTLLPSGHYGNNSRHFLPAFSYTFFSKVKNLLCIKFRIILCFKFFFSCIIKQKNFFKMFLSKTVTLGDLTALTLPRELPRNLSKILIFYLFSLFIFLFILEVLNVQCRTSHARQASSQGATCSPPSRFLL